VPLSNKEKNNPDGLSLWETASSNSRSKMEFSSNDHRLFTPCFAAGYSISKTWSLAANLFAVDVSCSAAMTTGSVDDDARSSQTTDIGSSKWTGISIKIKYQIIEGYYKLFFKCQFIQQTDLLGLILLMHQHHLNHVSHNDFQRGQQL